MQDRKSNKPDSHPQPPRFHAHGPRRRRRARAAGRIRGAGLRGRPCRRSAPGRPARPADSVFIGIAVPRTGTYAVQGEDELKGWQLAVEHINAGHPLIRQISPKTKKGVLGKEVKYGVADSAAKPNDAVQAQQRFITENKAILMTGSTSSAVAVALNKLAQREKVLYVAGISGSNDTTGKDCVRYGFRQCFYGQTAAAAIGPVLVKAYGKNKKAAYLTPDYTYGHTVTKSMQDYLATARLDDGDEPGRAARRARLLVVPAQRRQLRRRRADQRQLGPRRGAVDPAGQAVRHLRQDEAGHPLPDPVPGARGRRRPARRRLCRHRFLVDAGGQVSARQDVRRGVREEVRLQAGMGREQRLHANSRCGPRRSRTPAPSIRRTSSSRTRPAARSSRPSARCTSARRTTSSSARWSSSRARSQPT